MDRFQQLSVFVAVAEAASFAKAARRLSMSAPAVTRAIAALEERLAVKLFDRTTRYVRATEAGQRYLEDARRILSDLAEADDAAAGMNAKPRGVLAITAPVLFGRLFVLPPILEYLKRYPETTVSALFVDRVVNLWEEGFDVGVRIGELPDSRLRATRVGQVRRILCASPAYLREHGTPKTPADLAQHVIIAAVGISPTAEWRFSRSGQVAAVHVTPRLTVATNDAAVDAAVRGLGITRLLSYQVASHADRGELRVVLPGWDERTLPVHVLHREGRYGSARVRAFVDLAVEHLRKTAALS